jgi:hypothetical protein
MSTEHAFTERQVDGARYILSQTDLRKAPTLPGFDESKLRDFHRVSAKNADEFWVLPVLRGGGFRLEN